jgi:hypothetical protein
VSSRRTSRTFVVSSDVPLVSRADLGASARRQPGIHDDATELAAQAFEITAGVLLTISTDCGQGNRRTDRAQHAQVAEDERSHDEGEHQSRRGHHRAPITRTLRATR